MTREACEEFMDGDGGVMLLLADGEFARALERIVSQGHLYPEIRKMLYSLRIALAANLDDIPGALQVMEAALAEGTFLPAAVFSPQADPPGYAVLSGNPDFERLKETHQQRYRTAIDAAEPVLNRMHPAAPVNEPPLLVAFHGNTSNIELEADHYRHAADLGWLAIQPQSAQSWTDWGYVWGDMDITERQVRAYWRLIQAQDSFDRRRIVTAGISKGGEIAIWSVMSGIIPARGFIAIAPSGPLISDRQQLTALIASRIGSELRGYLLVGDEDRWGLEGTQQLAAVLKEAGFACELEICPGLGHEFPQDFGLKLLHALQFVTQT